MCAELSEFLPVELMDMIFDDKKWKTVFPSLNVVARCLDMVNNPTMKGDLWRYLQLWETGGLYADIDNG